jgi:hypothetical protein
MKLLTNKVTCRLPEARKTGERWLLEGLTEESEHTRWFLSMTAMLGAVRAHYSHRQPLIRGHLLFLLIDPLRLFFGRSFAVLGIMWTCISV